ncbi:MAG: hypothetical protein EOO75_13395 [Myxococcales bacterium]|nr:MAG: hypothetical protein EOO75_13395 [Myxococcales bacterium]
MPPSRAARWLGATLALGGGLLLSGQAWAVDCASLPSPVYGRGGSAAKPTLGKIGGALTKVGGQPTLIYQAPGACFGINALLSGEKMTGTASYWDAAGKEQTCDLPLTGVDVDFANMGNSAVLCPGVTSLPAGIGDFSASVQAFDFLVPKASSQTVISSEAAYFVYGFGAQGQAEPWTDESQIIRRDENSAAQIFIGLSVGVPVSKFKGVDAKTNGNSVTLVSTSPSPEKAIGFASSEVADANRNVINVLAYKHRDQSCGYYPDSSANARDKLNVRTGQYQIWAPNHFFAKVGADGKISDPDTAKLIGYFTHETPDPAGFNSLELVIQAGAIPRCAMEVWREVDLAAPVSNAPAEPCGCFFDATATGTSSCQACPGGQDSECSASSPHCRFGYCEVN